MGTVGPPEVIDGACLCRQWRATIAQLTDQTSARAIKTSEVCDLTPSGTGPDFPTYSIMIVSHSPSQAVAVPFFQTHKPDSELTLDTTLPLMAHGKDDHSLLFKLGHLGY